VKDNKNTVQPKASNVKNKNAKAPNVKETKTTEPKAKTKENKT
jgi:hypothetical protein